MLQAQPLSSLHTSLGGEVGVNQIAPPKDRELQWERTACRGDQGSVSRDDRRTSWSRAGQGPQTSRSQREAWRSSSKVWGAQCLGRRARWHPTGLWALKSEVILLGGFAASLPATPFMQTPALQRWPHPSQPPPLSYPHSQGTGRTPCFLCWCMARVFHPLPPICH